MNETSALEHYLDALHPLSWEQKQRFFSLFTAFAIEKNVHLLRAGDRVEHLYFCLSGSFRMYYSTFEGRERVKTLGAAGDFVTSYSALLTGCPSSISIQALQSSKLLKARFSDFKALTAVDPVWERVARLVSEGLYIKKERREMQLLTLSAEERYLIFLNEFGPWEDQFPQHHIASYLGMTPVALSRIRSKLKKQFH
ncbi:Crp/Fnr family transcriptional regulator [Paenibacillus sp. SI8]|uniref:Crp/Fnr family transcriptional regulator n=1 Tax=unclassified Paenibacillus TaxID=185978 RepID=UPI003465A254